MFWDPDGCSQRNTVPADEVGSQEPSFYLPPDPQRRQPDCHQQVLGVLPCKGSVPLTSEGFKCPLVTVL